ncbi:MAG: hypothetical protein AAGF11_24835 [Myxococcota bacterium]
MLRSFLRFGLAWSLTLWLAACAESPPAAGSTTPTGTGSTGGSGSTQAASSSTGAGSADSTEEAPGTSGSTTLAGTTGADPTTTDSGGETTIRPTITRIADFVAAVHGMAVDDDGLLYFSDTFTVLDTTARVYRLEPPYIGQPEATALSGPRPAGLAFIDGDLHVCDVDAGTVTRYNAALVSTQTWVVPSPWNVAPLASGERVVVTFDNRLFALLPDGTVQERLTDLGAPFDLAPTPAGAVWISEQGAGGPGQPGRLAQWDARGAMILEARYPWANPEGLAFDPQGDLWVAETERQELLRVSPQGEVELMAQIDGLPIVITPLPSGDLLVSVTGPKPHLLQVEFDR